MGPPPVFEARVLGLFLCVRLPLTYLRHNPPQELLAEVHGVRQATASRVIGACAPPIASALREHVPTVEDLDLTAQLIIDGALLQCWSWKDRPELDLGRAQDHRAEHPGRLRHRRGPGLGVRPPGRETPRHQGPAPLRPARRPHRRPARRNATTAAHRRRGVHRPGRAHSQEKTREATASPC